MQKFLRGSFLLLVTCCLGQGPACKNDPKATTTAAGPVEPVAEPAQPSPKNTPKALTKRRKPDDSSAALLRYLPRDSSVVIGLNWRKARKSEVVRSYDEKIAKAVPLLAEIKAKCGSDPVTAVHSAALALGQDPSNDGDMVVALSGDFDRTLFDSCVVTLGGAVEGNRYNSVVNAYWPGENIIVLSMGISSEQLALAPSASAWDNDKLMILVDELDLHASLWMAGMLPSSVAASFASMGATPWGSYAFLDIESWMRVTLGLEYATPSDAESALNMLNMAMPMLKQQGQMSALVDSIIPGVVGSALVVAGDFSAEQVAEIQILLKQLGL